MSVIAAGARRPARSDRALPEGPRRPEVLQSIAWVTRPVEMLRECGRRFGKRFTLRFHGGRAYVIVADPDDVGAVFTAPPDVLLSGRANQNFEPFFGRSSLLVLDGDKHRRHRRLLMPPLRGERLRALTPTIHEIVQERVSRWPAGTPFRAIDELRGIALEVIFRALFGVREAARARRLAELVDELTRATAWLALLRLPRIDAGRLSPWGRFRRARQEFRELLLDEVRAIRRGERSRDDVLAGIVDEGTRHADPLGDDELTDELLTLLAAGHETTVAALAWALHWILGDEAVRRRAEAEVREAVGAGGLSSACLDAMPYLEAAAQEALRITPVIPIVPRIAAVDTEVAGIDLPAGTWIAPCPILTHHDPGLYPQPARFDPTRFLGRRPSPFEYFPFGGGGRLCIGAAFAMHEIKTVLASLFVHAELRRADGKPQRAGRHGLTLVPSRGTPVVLERRRV